MIIKANKRIFLSPAVKMHPVCRITEASWWDAGCFGAFWRDVHWLIFWLDMFWGHMSVVCQLTLFSLIQLCRKEEKKWGTSFISGSSAHITECLHSSWRLMCISWASSHFALLAVLHVSTVSERAAIRDVCSWAKGSDSKFNRYLASLVDRRVATFYRTLLIGWCWNETTADLCSTEPRSASVFEYRGQMWRTKDRWKQMKIKDEATFSDLHWFLS